MLKQYRLSLAALLCTLSLASCAGGWTEEDKKQFTQDCRNAVRSDLNDEKAATYCDCFTNKMVEIYPVFNDAMEHRDSAKLENAKAECRKAIGMQ
jgi:hypothetical protein